VASEWRRVDASWVLSTGARADASCARRICHGAGLWGAGARTVEEEEEVVVVEWEVPIAEESASGYSARMRTWI